VSFGPIGRTLCTALIVLVGVGAFELVDRGLQIRALAWWVLACWMLFATPIVLRDIWRPVRCGARR
jgi:hypothetical protein